MMKPMDRYRFIEENELFIEGDEMLNPITGIWEPIPDPWLEKQTFFKNENTIKNFNIKFRRIIYSS